MRKQKHIICLEAEWRFTNAVDKQHKFDFKTEGMLELVSVYHQIGVIHRNVLNTDSLQHYMQMLSPHRQGMAKYGIVYIASHGGPHSICLEDNWNIDLVDLAKMGNEADGFFEGRIVHFGCCKTLSSKAAVERFKQDTGALLVTGYSKLVDTMKCAIADAALFDNLVKLEKVETITNRVRSAFWKTYGSLLDELGFKSY